MKIAKTEKKMKIHSGMIHLAEENAVLHAKAPIKVSGGTQ